jgi:hypothetical protein
VERPIEETITPFYYRMGIMQNIFRLRVLFLLALSTILMGMSVDGTFSGDKPDDSVMAEIQKSDGWRPTAVVIGPSYIVTVGHWGDFSHTNTKVHIGNPSNHSVEYTIVEGHRTTAPDLAVYHLHDANGKNAHLTNYVDFYTNRDEYLQVGCFASFGPNILNDKTTCTLRWGNNFIEDWNRMFNDSYDDWALNSNPCIQGHPYQHWVPYETTLMDKDSGTAVFLKDNSTWKLAGLHYTLYDALRFGYTVHPQHTVWTFIETVDNRLAEADMHYWKRGCNSPLEDLDGDYDVDGADFGLFSGCFNGTGNLVTEECRCSDFNNDGWVDGSDYGLFSSCFNGAGNEPACV